MAEVAQASEEQRSGIDQVNQAIAQMDQVTQQNAALVEEAAAAAQSLQEEAGNLSQVVATFKLDDEDEQPAAAPPVVEARPLARAVPLAQLARRAIAIPQGKPSA